MDAPQRRRMGGCTLILLLIGLLSACGNPPTAQNPRPPLRFGYVLWPGYYPALIAQDQGYFASAGTTASTTLVPKTDTMLSDFAAGNYDVIALALGSFVGLNQTDPDTRIIALVDDSAGGDAVIASPGISKVSELRGKRIGANFGTFSELFVITMLDQNGLTANDVTLVDMDAADVPDQIAAGAIDAGHTWEPHMSEAIAKGQTLLFSSAETPGLIADVLAVRGETARQRPDDVRAFAKGWFQAADYWLSHPAEGVRIAAKALNKPADSISLSGIKLATATDNRAAFALGTTTASLHHTTQLYVDFYARFGGIRQAPNLPQILDGSFVPQP